MEYTLLKQIYEKYKTKEVQREELEAFLTIKYNYTYGTLLNCMSNLEHWEYVEELKNQEGTYNIRITSRGENIIKEDFTLFSKIKRYIHNNKRKRKTTINKINNWFNINIK